MAQPTKFIYRDWYITSFSIPQEDGKWAVSCEIRRVETTEAEVVDSSRGLLEPVVCDEKEEALTLAYESAKRHIDDITANPLG